MGTRWLDTRLRRQRGQIAFVRIAVVHAAHEPFRALGRGVAVSHAPSIGAGKGGKIETVLRPVDGLTQGWRSRREALVLIQCQRQEGRINRRFLGQQRGFQRGPIHVARWQILGPIEQLVDRMHQQFHVTVGVSLLDPASAGGRGEHPEHRGRGVQSRIGGLIRVVGNHAVVAIAGRPEGIPLPPRQPLDQHRQRAGVDVHRPARLYQRHVAQVHRPERIAVHGSNRKSMVSTRLKSGRPSTVQWAPASANGASIETVASVAGNSNR